MFKFPRRFLGSGKRENIDIRVEKGYLEKNGWRKEEGREEGWRKSGPRGLILDGEQGFPFLSDVTELDQIQLLVLVGKMEEYAREH